MKRKHFFYLMILFILFSFLFSQERGFQVVGKESLIALIIGNACYKSFPLRNPVNDAEDMAGVLRERGFEVIMRTDANHRDMEKAIREFGKKLRNGGVGLFYFSGHGMQVNGVNYLIPVNEDIKAEDEIKYKAVDANFVLSKMESAGNAMNIMILDACRDNPFARSFRSLARGLAQMDAPQGTLIVYATAPGRTADDGTGRNGIFTRNLLDFIKQSNLEITQILKEVRRRVIDETDGKQIPWEASSIIGNFYFNQNKKQAVFQDVVQPNHSRTKIDLAGLELEFWKTIKDSKNPKGFQAYLDKFPNGTFSELAKNKIKELEYAFGTDVSKIKPLYGRVRYKLMDIQQNVTLKEEDLNIYRIYKEGRNIKDRPDRVYFEDHYVRIHDDFVIGLNQYGYKNERSITGFGIWIKRLNSRTFSWEWYKKVGSNLFKKLQGKGYIETEFSKRDDFWVISKIKFVGNQVLRSQYSWEKTGKMHWHCIIYDGSLIVW